MNIISCILLIFLGWSCSFSFGVDYEANIQIQQGTLRGKVSHSRTGRKFLEFLGIPYAGPPKRFQVVGTPPRWKGIRDATYFGPKCLQLNGKTKAVEGSEDCLYLNVYTRVYSNPTQTRLPVMVWIHGGAFVSGSGSSYDPSYFMDEDVIIVTFNYRLGAFGFVTTLNKNLMPNLGMKDQVAALTWVKNNIHYFGGDDKRITIFGSSAGAASVSYHLLSPMSNGLFHRAISQSGNALCPWSFQQNPHEVANRLGALMNCSTANTFTIAACLRQADATQIVLKQQMLIGWHPHSLSPVPFAPVVELIAHAIETGPMFLSDTPKNLLRLGRFKKIPWLTGFNSADGITLSTSEFLTNRTLLKALDDNWSTIAPVLFSYKDTAPNPHHVSQKLREFYFGHNNGVIDESVRQDLAHALSDRYFYRCTKHSALLLARQNPVWVYYFMYQNNISSVDNFGISPSRMGIKGVAHLDELQYLFKMGIFPEIGDESLHYEFSQSLIGLWVSFATEGRPRELWGDAVTWHPVPADQIQRTHSPMELYKIDKNTELIPEPFYYRLAFWDKLRLLPPQAGSSFSSSSKNLAPDPEDNNSCFSSLSSYFVVTITFIISVGIHIV